MPRLDEVSLSSLVVPDRLLNLPHRCHKVVHVLVLDKGGGPERRPVNNVLICEPRPRPIHELSDPRPIDGAAFVGNDDVEAVWSLRLLDRKSTRLNSSHVAISSAVFSLTKKNKPLHPLSATNT